MDAPLSLTVGYYLSLMRHCAHMKCPIHTHTYVNVHIPATGTNRAIGTTKKGCHLRDSHILSNRLNNYSSFSSFFISSILASSSA